MAKRVAVRKKRRTPEETLLEAARLIREKGWIQKEEVNSEGAMCAIGAYKAAGDGLEALRLLCQRIQATGHKRFGGCNCALCQADATEDPTEGYVTDWNDSPGRTKAQVLAVLEGRPLRTQAKRA